MLGREDGVMVRKYRVWPAREEQQELGAPASRGRAAAYRRNGYAAWRGGGSGAGPGAQGEPRLIAPACSGPPEGPAGWTLRLPADRCAQREAAGNVSTVPVRRTLRERAEAPVPQRGRLRLRERSRIPPQGNAEFVCDGVSRRTVSAIPAGRGIPGRESLTQWVS